MSYQDKIIRRIQGEALDLVKCLAEDYKTKISDRNIQVIWMYSLGMDYKYIHKLVCTEEDPVSLATIRRLKSYHKDLIKFVSEFVHGQYTLHSLI
ncbi:hypothetical protein DDN72_17610 [Vibrio cholerae]|nr:hypothetical protein [Vibrio cholerae]